MEYKNIYQTYLNETISRQCSATKGHIDHHRAVFANNRNIAGFTSTLKELIFTLGIKSAAGAYFKDLDGNAYLDMSMGFGVHLFGHRPAFIEDAIKEQLEKGIALGPIFEDTAVVAKLIHELTGNERCAFYNSGTEAVMVAMRIARAATGKNKVVIFEGSYHGTHDSLLGIKSNEETHVMHTTVPGVTQSAVNETMLLPFGNERSLAIIKEHAQEVAAVLTEPVMSRHPELISEDFLKKLRALCTEMGIALIFDEVITGFRVGNGGAAELFRIKPDIATYGKIAGGGIPIGIVAGKRHFLDMIDGGQWRYGDLSAPNGRISFTAGTFNHHPLAMAAARSVLNFLKDRNGVIQDELNVTSEKMCGLLNEFFREEGYPISLVYFGSLFRFMVKGQARLLFYSLLKEMVYIWEGRNCFLSSAHSAADITNFIIKVKQCCFELDAANLLHSNNRNHYDIPASVPILAGIKVNKALDLEKLTYACRYLFVAIPALRRSNCIITFQTGSLDHTNDRCATFLVSLSGDSDSTFLYVSADRNICDGWSLILFFKYLSKTYNALIRNLPLPDVNFEEEISLHGGHIAQKNQSTILNASTIHQFVLLKNYERSRLGNLFHLLLYCFQNTLGQDENKMELNRDRILVPVAGQLQSRKLRAFGQYTIYKEICRNGNQTYGWQMNQDVLKQPIAGSNGSSPADVVFNLDNLKFQLEFDSERAIFTPMDESVTMHSIVCNVSQFDMGLVISLKYATDRIKGDDAKDFLSRYIHCIKQAVVEHI